MRVRHNMWGITLYYRPKKDRQRLNQRPSGLLRIVEWNANNNKESEYAQTPSSSKL